LLLSIIVLIALVTWWVRAHGGHSYTLDLSFGGSSDVKIQATPFIPPKALSALVSDYVEATVSIGDLTFSTDDPQFQCLEGLAPLFFVESPEFADVLLAVYNNCTGLLGRAAPPLAMAAYPLTPLADCSTTDTTNSGTPCGCQGSMLQSP